MMRSFRKFSRLVAVLGVFGSVRYLSMGGLADCGDISRYRPVRVAVGEAAWSMEAVRKAALLALKRLPCQVQTVVISGKCCQIMATVDEVGVLMRLKRISDQITRIAINVARATSLGQATADTILEQTCRLAPQMIGSRTLKDPFNGMDIFQCFDNSAGKKEAA